MDNGAQARSVFARFSFWPGGAMRRHRRVLSDAAWLVVSHLVAAVALLGGNRLITQYVPPAVFGAISLLLGILNFQRSIVLYPLGQAVYRFHADVENNQKVWLLRRVARNLLLRYGGIMAGLFLVIGCIYCGVKGVSFVVPALLALLFTLEGVRSTEAQILSAARRQRAGALLSMLDSISRPLLVVGSVLLLSASPTSILLGQLASLLPVVALTLLLVPRAHRGDHLADAGEESTLRRDMIRFALPLMPLVVVGWINNLSDRYVIGALLGNAAVGTYTAVYGIASQPFLVLHSVLGLTILPMYNAAIARGDRATERRFFSMRLFATIALAAIGVVISWFMKDLLARWFVGPEYRDGGALIPWIGAGYACLAVALVFEGAFLSHKRSKLILLAEAIGAVACLPSQYIMIKLFGMSGAAMAVPCYFGVQCIAAAVLYQMMIRQSRDVSPVSQSVEAAP